MHWQFLDMHLPLTVPSEEVVLKEKLLSTHQAKHYNHSVKRNQGENAAITWDPCRRSSAGWLLPRARESWRTGGG